jgi:hypothetical protein
MSLPIHIRKLGRLFRGYFTLQRERTPTWAIALALLLYPSGVSLRRIAAYLSWHGVNRAHTFGIGSSKLGGGSPHGKDHSQRGSSSTRLGLKWEGGIAGSSQRSIPRPRGSSM